MNIWSNVHVNDFKVCKLCDSKHCISGTDSTSFAISSAGVLTTSAAVNAATKASYNVDITATNTVTGHGKVALTVNVQSTCSTATQITAVIGIVLLSLMTVMSIQMPSTCIHVTVLQNTDTHLCTGVNPDSFYHCKMKS